MEGAGLAEKVTTLRSFINSMGYLGPAAFVAVSTAAIMVYIPAVVVVCVAVCIFGGITGALLATASIYLAVTAVYFTAQFLGRDLVVHVAGRKFSEFESRLEGKGLVTVIYMRLFFFVFPPTNWLLGLSALRFRDVFLGTVLGTVHHIIIFSWMTDAVMEVIRTGGSLNPLETKKLLIPMLAGMFVFAAIHIISYRMRRSKPPLG
ncbi:MAG: TVP38/TMEM64 family protein [Desulfosalsimonas sp.]